MGRIRVLDSINYGYDALEPVIVGLVALDKRFMLIGRHGTGKTRLARSLSRAFGEDAFVFYDATKDDLVSIAGIPDPESLKRGQLRFVPHERSIWNKATIVVDEITRAGKESQNLWLEILEQRTCFRLPLADKALITTANPESQAAAFQLDEALLDRVHAVLPVPEHQHGVFRRGRQGDGRARRAGRVRRRRSSSAGVDVRGDPRRPRRAAARGRARGSPIISASSSPRSSAC